MASLGARSSSAPVAAAEAQERHFYAAPRRLVSEARTYLRNNQKRMVDPRYRRAGLPTTNSPVESLVGGIDAGVKDERKHWTRPHGAE